VTERWTSEQIGAFERDGFLVVEKGFIDADTVELLRERFDGLFQGDYETGIRPDEVNWVPGRDPDDRTRQICNGWKADPWIAAQVLSERTGRLAAELIGWDGVRLLQDNCIWKPPGTKSLGMHQDGSYLDYLVPPEMVTCWVALDDTSAEAGTITLRGRLPPVAAVTREPRRISRADRLARSGPPCRARRRGASSRSDRGEGRRRGAPSLQHLPRLGSE
jgi:ectoine hydroxylase-related dioxygenase (phytanoyl-CoA dioxygenase family)